MADYIVLAVVVAAALACWRWSDKASRTERDLVVLRTEIQILHADSKALAQRNQERLIRIMDAANAMRPFISRSWTPEQAEEYRIAIIRMCEAQLVRALTDAVDPEVAS